MYGGGVPPGSGGVAGGTGTGANCGGGPAPPGGGISPIIPGAPNGPDACSYVCRHFRFRRDQSARPTIAPMIAASATKKGSAFVGPPNTFEMDSPVSSGVTVTVALAS